MNQNQVIVSMFSPILVNQQVLGALQNIGQYVPRQQAFAGFKPETVQVGIYDSTTNTVWIFEAEGRNLSQRLRTELRQGLDENAATCEIKIGSDNHVSQYLDAQMPMVAINGALNKLGKAIPRGDWTRVKQDTRELVRNFFTTSFETADKRDQRLGCGQKLATTQGQETLNHTTEAIIDRFFSQVTSIRQVSLNQTTKQTVTTTEATLMGALMQEVRLNVLPLTPPDNTYAATTLQTNERELATTAGTRATTRN